MTRRPIARAIAVAFVGLALLAAGVAVQPVPAGAAATPGELLVFHGWPSRINGATTATQAAAEYARYDFVVFGTGIEVVAHPDHARTKAVLAEPAMADTVVFGYVNLGVTNGKLTIAQIKQRVRMWQDLGADGIQLDAMGYDWGVTRARQNTVIDYIHSLGMPVLANGWVPDHVFGSGTDPLYPQGNPNGTATHLGQSDFYMFESYWIRLGVPPSADSSNGWTSQYFDEKVASLAAYQAQLGFGILSVTTNSPSDQYSQASLDAAFNLAVRDGHAAFGWGEYVFSADDNSAPFRPRPGAAVLCNGRPATIVGTAGPDNLAGTANADVIAGLGGADVINGLGGDDVICGAGGDDTIRGGDGVDRVFGGPGADQIYGDAGNDILNGQGGNDVIRGGDGADRLNGHAGADELYGGNGNDVLDGGPGNDLLLGEAGNDRAIGGPDTDSCVAEQTQTCEV